MIEAVRSNLVEFGETLTTGVSAQAVSRHSKIKPSLLKIFLSHRPPLLKSPLFHLIIIQDGSDLKLGLCVTEIERENVSESERESVLANRLPKKVTLENSFSSFCLF